MTADLETLTRDYWRAVQRIRRMAVPAADRAIVLADVQVIYRAKRAATPRKAGRLVGPGPFPL